MKIHEVTPSDIIIVTPGAYKGKSALPENKDIRLQFPYTIKNCVRIFTFVNVLAALEDELLLGILAVIK